MKDMKCRVCGKIGKVDDKALACVCWECIQKSKSSKIEEKEIIKDEKIQRGKFSEKKLELPRK